MFDRCTQKTLAKPITLYGTGVHSNQPVVVTLKPAAIGRGIFFTRQDVKPAVATVPVRWDRVVDTRMCTTIANEAGTQVSTIEHLMAALYAYEITNIEIILNGPELPIMDGSAQSFAEAIQAAGIADQGISQAYLKVLRPTYLQDDQRQVSLLPSSTSIYECEHSFAPRAQLPNQTYKCSGHPATIRQEILAARTFGFAEDIDHLQAHGFALGASLQNAVAIQHDTFLNPEGLRYGEECARHKILDAIGDLYTIGMPILGHFLGFQSGHALVSKLLHKLFAQQDAWEVVGLSTPSIAVQVRTAPQQAYAI